MAEKRREKEWLRQGKRRLEREQEQKILFLVRERLEKKTKKTVLDFVFGFSVNTTTWWCLSAVAGG